MNSDATNSYDLAVIGSGPAGEKAAMKAANLGARVVIIEKSSKPGGNSLITGTVPSKAIRETVQHIKILDNRAMIGFQTGMGGYSMRDVMHRKDVVIEKKVNHIFQRYREKQITYINGTARFKDPHTLTVIQGGSGSIEIQAKKIVIAVGSGPYHPEDIAFDGKLILDSNSILDLEEIPTSICVFGGGVIGCEYATIFANLGSLVTLVDPRGVLLNFLDEDLSVTLAHHMRAMNINLRLGEDYESITAKEDHVETRLHSGKVIHTSVLLYANGRQGMTDGLNLEQIGLKTNARNQLDVDQNNYTTALEHIYAVGDIIGFPSLASTGAEQGRRAGEHAICGHNRELNLSNSPLGIYTIPEISAVGRTSAELTRDKIPFEAGVCQFDALTRTSLAGDTRGMLKILFHTETLELLGVHIIGLGASELIHIGQAVLHFKGKIDYFLAEVMNYPTVAHAYKIATINGLERIKPVY